MLRVAGNILDKEANRMGKGWWSEGARHSLASRGIKTGTKVKATMPMARSDPKASGRTTFDLMMEFEGGNLTKREFLTLFSRLIKSGQAWTLQGFYGRQAHDLITEGWVDRNGKINWDKVGNTEENIYDE